MRPERPSFLTPAVLFLSLILVGCAGKAMDPVPDNEKQGPGLFSGESGTFPIHGKRDPAEPTAKQKKKEIFR